MKSHHKLKATWSKKERDVMLHYPLGQGTRADGHYLSGIFNKAFTDELSNRGYDVSTLKFEVSPVQGNSKFASQRVAPVAVDF